MDENSKKFMIRGLGGADRVVIDASALIDRAERAEDEMIALLERAEKAESERDALQRELADGSFYKESTIDDLQARAERAEQWNREMVEKAASGGTLDAYREMGAKLAAAEERAEKAEAERDEMGRRLNTARYGEKHFGSQIDAIHTETLEAERAVLRRNLSDDVVERLARHLFDRTDPNLLWRELEEPTRVYFRHEAVEILRVITEES